MYSYHNLEASALTFAIIIYYIHTPPPSIHKLILPEHGDVSEDKFIFI